MKNIPNRTVVGFAIGMGITFAAILLILSIASATPGTEGLLALLAVLFAAAILSFIAILFIRKLHHVAMGMLLAFALPALLFGWCASMW